MTRAILVGTVVAVLVAPNATAQTPPAAIFSAVDGAIADRTAASAVSTPKGVADRRLMGMHLDRLFDNSRVLLDVDGREWVATFERLDADIQGHRVWVGSIEGIDYSHVSFAERSGVVSGLINGVSDTYAVRTIEPGVYALDRVSQSGNELEPLAPGAADVATSALSATAAADDGSLIDVAILYTPGARAAVGGTTQMNAMVAQIISDTNTIFSRSGIAPRVRLVGSMEMALPETSSMSSDLGSLRANATVNTYRESVGADLVQLIMNSLDSTACGIGYLLDQSSAASPATFPAYSISDYSCVAGYTPTHEMGHNMGSHHAPEDGASGALFTYSYGYKDAVRAFRTVMAYPCTASNCPRIANFSNPVVSHNGGATGTATQNNASSIINAATTVANFRQAGTTPTAPPPPTNLTSQVNGLNVTVSWNAASAATGYVLQVGSAPGMYNLLTYPTGSATSVSGTAPAGTYYWRVFGTNSAGNGVPSAEARFTLGGCAPPGAPQTFTHVVSPTRVVTLNWAAPATGAAPFSYVIDAGSGPGLTNILSAPVGGATSVSVAAPPGTYYVRIRAANACAQTSPASNEQIIVVP